MIKAFGIFEGGGAKGLAHIGALSAAEENQIEFVGFAGSSAGAIVASLLAVGYTSKELFDSSDRQANSIFDENLVTYFGRIRWWLIAIPTKIKRFIGRSRFIGFPIYAMMALMTVTGIFLLLLSLWDGAEESVIWFVAALAVILSIVYLMTWSVPRGFFSTNDFEGWLNEKLHRKLFGDAPVKTILFRDVDIPLKIIATDLRSRQPIVFSRDEKFADYSVAKAVRSSIAIPGVFAPCVDKDMMLVDGGILSNFPAWVFDRELRQTDEIISTIGFRLNNSNSENSDGAEDTILRYALDLGRVFFGDSKLQTRAIEDLHLIPIKVTARTLDFHLDRDQKNALYNEGYVAAQKFFRNDFTGPRNSERISLCLKQLEGAIRDVVSVPDARLRFNVAVRVEPLKEDLRILYHLNMDDDADDRLQLPIGAGAIGECWNEGHPIYADMVEAKKIHKTRWKMSKYKQALVKSDLKSLLSVPVTASGSIMELGDEKILAILSIDSMDDLSGDFSAAIEEASEIALCLSEWTRSLARELRW